MTNSTIDRIRAINPVPDQGDLVSSQTKDTLAVGIMQTSTPVKVHPLRKPARVITRRVLPALVAAGLVGGFALSSIERPDGTTTEALSFTTRGNTIEVKVVDPYADPKRYNAEFKKRGLDIHLTTSPASPSAVGKFDQALFSNDDPAQKRRIDYTTTQPAGCVQVLDPDCVAVLLIPVNYKGTAEFFYGRPARPGEVYSHVGFLDSPGEVFAGVKWKNKTVGEIKKLLADRNQTIHGYFNKPKGKEVPDNWYVVDGSPYSPGTVKLIVSRKPVG